MINTGPFIEVISITGGSPTGITVSPDGKVQVNLVVLPQPFTVMGSVTTVGPTNNNTVSTLTFALGSSLNIFNTLTVTDGPVYLAPTSSMNLGASPFGNATLDASQRDVPFGVALTGNGTIIGDLINSGLVSPGNSPGEIHVTGKYTQMPTYWERGQVVPGCCPNPERTD